MRKFKIALRIFFITWIIICLPGAIIFIINMNSKTGNIYTRFLDDMPISIQLLIGGGSVIESIIIALIGGLAIPFLIVGYISDFFSWMFKK